MGTKYTKEGKWNKRFSLVTFESFVFKNHPKIIKCSTIGPSARAGKKLNAPTIMMTPMTHTMKSGVCVGNVPALAGTFFLFASEPAIASTGIASQ